MQPATCSPAALRLAAADARASTARRAFIRESIDPHAVRAAIDSPTTASRPTM
nr:hypothetical protein [Nocardia salmonicida]